MGEEITTVKRVLEDFMRRVKGVTCYPDKLRVYAPTCYGKCEHIVKDLRKRLDYIFKGSTTYDAEGCWVYYDKEKGKWERECEPVKVIEIATFCLTPDKAKKFIDGLIWYATRAKQYSIAVENGQFYIAETEEMLKALKESLKKK